MHSVPKGLRILSEQDGELATDCTFGLFFGPGCVFVGPEAGLDTNRMIRQTSPLSCSQFLCC